MKRWKLVLNNKGDTLITALISSIILAIVSLGLIKGFLISSKTNAVGDYMERSSVIAQYVMERVCSLGPDNASIKGNGTYGDYKSPDSNSSINNLIPGLTDEIDKRFPFYKTNGKVNYGIRVDISDPIGTLDANVTPNMKVITVTVEPSMAIKKFIFGTKNISNKVVVGSISRTLKYVE